MWNLENFELFSFCLNYNVFNLFHFFLKQHHGFCNLIPRWLHHKILCPCYQNNLIYSWFTPIFNRHHWAFNTEWASHCIHIQKEYIVLCHEKSRWWDKGKKHGRGMQYKLTNMHEKMCTEESPSHYSSMEWCMQLISHLQTMMKILHTI